MTPVPTSECSTLAKIDFDPVPNEKVRITIRRPSGVSFTFTVPTEPLVPLEPESLAESA